MVVRECFLKRDEQRALRTAMNRTWNKHSIPDGFREKYEKVVAASLSSHGMR